MYGRLAGFLGFAAHLPFVLVTALCFVYGVTVSADSSPITAGTVAEAQPERRGTTMAMHACIGFIGSFLGPLVFGIVLDISGGGVTVHSWGFAFASMGAMVALGPVLLVLLTRAAGRSERRKKPPPPDVQASTSRDR
jgi:MFS family permease